VGSEIHEFANLGLSRVRAILRSGSGVGKWMGSWDLSCGRYLS